MFGTDRYLKSSIDILLFNLCNMSREFCITGYCISGTYFKFSIDNYCFGQFNRFRLISAIGYCIGIGTWNYLSVPIYSYNRFRSFWAIIGYCACNRYVNLSIDTYPLRQQLVQIKLYNRLLFVGLVVCIFFYRYLLIWPNRFGEICIMGCCTCGKNLTLNYRLIPMNLVHKNEDVFVQ